MYRRLAGAATACLLTAACADPDVSVRATDFSETDTATYLILSDQFERIRNVLKRPAKVCAAALPGGLYSGLSPVSPDVVDRLSAEQANAEIQLEIVSTYECLAYYVTNKGPFSPERSDLLALAGRGGGTCGDWFGGMYNQGNLNRDVQYRVEVTDGVARLTGGRGCAASLRWYRT